MPEEDDILEGVVRPPSEVPMVVNGLTPILNVSDIVASFAWFEALGWKKEWDWGDPPVFGSISNGNGKVVIFLCQGAQGLRGGPMPKFPGDDDCGSVWMSWWLPTRKAVDEAHARALALGYLVTHPPTEEPWGVREFHLRHPDGHTFRVSSGVDEAGEECP